MAITAAQLRVEVGADTRDAEAGIKKFDRTLNNIASGMTRTGAGLTTALTLPLIGIAAAAFDIGVSWESAFAGVTKTVSGTEEEMLALSNGIRDMARNMPATVEEIAAVAEAAGALGIASENILGFTRVMIDLGETTDLTSEQAASDLARFANITGMLQTDFDRLGSAIVALGNAGASTESEIVAMSMRIAAAGTTIGMSEAQILGWASALSSLGIQAEAGGTAISTVMIDMAQAVALGGEELALFAEVAGMSISAFRNLFAADASAALQQFVMGLGDLQAAGGNVFQTLEELGFADVRVRDTLLRLAGANDLVTDSIALSNQAWQENTALSNEAAIRYGTTASQLDIMKNRLRDLGITLNEVMKSTSGPLITGFNDFLLTLDTGLTTIAATNPALIEMGVGIAGVAAAVGPTILILGTLTGAVSAIGAPVALAITAIAGLGAAWVANVGGIQEITAQASSVLSTFWRYLSRVAESGEAFNSNLFQLPRSLAGLAFGVGQALVGVQEFGRNLQNLGSYAAEVAAKGNTLNIWLFTMSPAFAGFALRVGEAIVALQNFASGVQAAFSKTIFPDINSLWQDFQAGEFENIAKRIKQSVDVLVYNLDVELNIQAKADQLKSQLLGVVNALGTAIGNLDFSGAQANLNSLRDGILSGLSTAIDGIDFGQASTAFSGIVDGITKAINGLDLSAINWAMVFQRILLGPMGVALNAIQWVVGSENFAGLVTSVQTAFREINWGDIGTALAGLGTAVATQLGAVVSDMASDISAALPNVQLNLSGMMNSWTNAINNQDWSAVGRNLTSNISTAISDFMATDVSWAENFANQLPGRISAAIAAMEESDLNAAFSGLAVAVRGAIYGILTGIGQELSPMISSLNERFSSSMSALGADIRGSIASTVSGWNTAFSTALEGLGAAIRAQIANIFSGLLSSLGIAAGGGGGLGSVGGAFPLRDYAGGEVYDVGGKKGRPSMRPPAESAAMDIPPVEWDTYIKPLDWATYVTEFVWDTYIVPVTWNSYVEQLAWDSYVSPLEWASYVTSLVWDSFVPRIDWGSYVENLSWGNYVGDLSWGNYVPPLEWARFIPQFTQGPSSSESGQSAPVAAAGVSAAGAGAAGGITLNVYATVANDIDIHSLAQKLMREIQRNTR